MSLIRNFKNFNNICFKKFVNFKINDKHIGYVNKNLANKISNYFSSNFILTKNDLIFNSSNNSDLNFNNLTNFFNDVTKWFLKEQLITKITTEYINVSPLNEENILFKIERTVVNLFGIQAKGIHLNGYVIKNNKVYLWIAKRSKHKWLYPNKLDNIVAGAISIGYNVFNTLIKESLEEANINFVLASKAQFINELHYLYLYKNTIRNDIMFIYNLLLPLEFIPYQNDNEVESFKLIEATEVLHILTNSDNFKFNSAIATILFLLEMNIINSNNTPVKIMNGVLKHINTMAKKPVMVKN